MEAQKKLWKRQGAFIYILRQLKKDIEKYSSVLSSFIWENINRDKLTSEASQENFEKKCFWPQIVKKIVKLQVEQLFCPKGGGGGRNPLVSSFWKWGGGATLRPWVINPERESASPIVLITWGL